MVFFMKSRQLKIELVARLGEGPTMADAGQPPQPQPLGQQFISSGQPPLHAAQTETLGRCIHFTLLAIH